MATEAEVKDQLRECYDPHIPVNVLDLGLIYGVEIEDSNVEIKMTLTTPNCPMAGQLTEQARQQVLELDDVDEVEVDLVFEPPWSKDMITEEGQAQLDELGYM
ncbi:MAG: metal-sulfur cluster assembly factor [bacterium]